jgi:hypothetical protein
MGMALVLDIIGHCLWHQCGNYPHTLLRGCKLVQPPWKTVWRFIKKLKIELPYDPMKLLLGRNLPKGMSDTPLNIKLNINNEKQDCKGGTVGGY